LGTSITAQKHIFALNVRYVQAQPSRSCIQRSFVVTAHTQHLIFPMSSQIESLAASKQPREDVRRREVNVFSIMTQECNDVQLAHLVVQHRAFLSEAQSERHNNANNLGKGVGDSNIKYRLLNIVLNGPAIPGDVAFPQSLKTRLQVDRTASSNQTASRSQRAKRLWDAVSKLFGRLSTVVKCLENGMLLE
jgi:hypothetical protein